jgi:hypothetical protein
MPAWLSARPVLSWWGAALPRTGKLIVVHPTLAQTDVPAVLEDMRGDRNPKGQLRFTLAVTGLAPALIIGAVVVYRTTGVPLAAIALWAVALFLLPVVIGGWKRWSEDRDHQASLVRRAAPVTVGTALDAELWAIVRHFNSYRRPDQDSADAIRVLLAALTQLQGPDAIVCSPTSLAGSPGGRNTPLNTSATLAQRPGPRHLAPTPAR